MGTQTISSLQDILEHCTIQQTNKISLDSSSHLSMRWWTLVGDMGFYYVSITDTNILLYHCLLN